jgi:hypothetical protein
LSTSANALQFCEDVEMSYVVDGVFNRPGDLHVEDVEVTSRPPFPRS